MDLLSVFKRGSAGSASADPSPSLDSVATARKRARQRLIGATVLVVIAVVGFPLVFDSAPRPVSLDVPIDIPRKDGAPLLAIPATRSGDPVTAAGSGASAASTSPSATAPSVAASGSMITESSADAGPDIRAPRPDVRASVGPPGPPHVARAPTKPAAPATRPDQTRNPDDAARARALLDGRPVTKADTVSPPKANQPAPAVRPAPTLPGASPASTSPPSAAGTGSAAPTPTPTPAITLSADTRFVVQVAAFSSEPSAQDMRSKLEKAGVKSYTQIIETPQGKRIRVRVGPFSSRDEAEKAAGRIRSAGLPSSIVPL